MARVTDAANLMSLAGRRLQERRRMSGWITSWYVPRLKVSRMRSATPQRTLTISLCSLWRADYNP